jgi:phytoene dehydrogenase-like protein
MEDRVNMTDVAVVGGGLGGLAAATYAARGGRSVVLCEKASALGGRAVTTQVGEFHFNLGPHALYAGSHGIAVLRELGVPFTGAKPSPSGAFAVANGTKHALPGGFLSLLTTSLLSLPAKLETARLLGSFGRLDPRPLARLPIGEWIDAHVRHQEVRQLVAALVRVATYSHDPERLSAGSALAQVQSALSASVLYLDGGWQTLVDGLRAAAQAAGVRIVTAARATTVERADVTWRVRLADGTAIDAQAAVVAGGPETAAALFTGTMQAVAQRWAAAAIPVRAACLDLGLSRLPRPRATFALGIDRPLYLSVHSAVAALAPPGAAVIHVGKYLGSADSDPKLDERELEAAMDLVQPGWRDLVVQRRLLPNMVVANALPTAASGGTEGRPGPAVPGADDLYVVGDWVGRDGLLADASLASAKQAATLILQRADKPARAAA